MSTDPSVRPRRELSLLTLLLCFSVVWSAVWYVHAWHYFEDDAFIHLEFARSLALGHGFTFNGHIVYGDTSPLWVYLLIGVHALVPDWVVAGKVLAALGVVFAGAGAYFLTYRITANRLFAAAMVAVFVLNPFFAYWSFSGMETISAAGVALWGAYVISDPRPSAANFFWGCAIVGVGPILRPEMSFFSAILAVIVLYRFAKMPGNPARKAGLFAGGLCVAAGPTLLWSLYALRTFGLLVPNTNAAKRALPHDSIASRLVNLYAFGYPMLSLAVLSALVYVIYRTMQRGGNTVAPPLRVPIAGWVFLIWTAITSVFYVVNHTYIQTRYVFVSASGFVVIALAILYLNFPRLGRPAAALTAIFTLVLSLSATWPLLRAKAISDQDNVDMVDWVKHNVAPDAPVAIYNIGQFAFLSNHPVIDTGGITRTSVIPYLGDGPAVLQWARREGAQYIVYASQPMPDAQLVYSKQSPDTSWYANPWHPRYIQFYKIWKLPAGSPVAVKP